MCGGTYIYNVCEVIVGGGGGGGGGGVCVCVSVCVCTCSPVCVHGTREQLRKGRKKGKLNLKKSPHYGFEPIISCCGATVLGPVLLPKC